MSATVFVRRSEFDDHSAILALIGDSAHILGKRYGRFDVTNMIENATLGITAVDGEGRAIGYAAFFDYPALTPAIDQTSWPEWLVETHGHPEFTPQNSLWLAFFVADHMYEGEVAGNILRTAFTTLPEVDVFLLSLPPDQRLFAPMRQSFEFVPPLEGVAEPPCKLHACPRGLYIPNLRIRAARVEDHDDLVPVFNQQSEVLSARYGEFFIAEVIAAQDAKSQALVAEADGHAIGLMSLTSEIDVRLLDEYFELESFDGLLQPGPDSSPALPLRPPQPQPRTAEGGDEGEDAGAAQGAEPELVDRSSWRSNAFCITLFCMDESFESRAVDFVRPAFALFHDLDYCVVTLPHVTSEFGLLSLFSIVHAKGQEAVPGAAPFGHVLYVIHRAALSGQLLVREAQHADLPGARALCAGLHDEGANTPTQRNSPHSPPQVECQAQVVGIATVLEQGVDVAGLKLHYCLEDYILFSEHRADGHAQLEQLLINPLFAASTRFVLKELFRKARKSVLYMQLRHDVPVPDVTREFVQVKPRRQIQLPPHLALAAARAAHERGGGDVPPDCALYFLTRKLISEPKIQNNVSLIAPDGLPDGGVPAAGQPEEPAVAPNAFAASSFCYTRRELRQLALDARVTVIRANVADVDRVAKSVELAGSSERVPYDVLLLAPPLHDQTLAGLPEGSRAVGGAFSVSGGQVERDVDDYIRSAAWVRRAALEDTTALVYGATLSAYCSVQALLARGVQPERVRLVLPPGAPTPFADPRVELRVRGALAALGVAVLDELRLLSVRAGSDGSISSVRLADKNGKHERELPCALLLTADEPDVDDAIFRACNSNSLVYDGRLVIDARFRTSDASIFAAGPLTKFSRRYRGGINLEHYDKRDVGVKVAHSLLPLLDPLSAAATAATSDALPTFDQPRSEGGMLPGGLLYVHVQRPSKPLPYDELVRSGRVGRELTTVANEHDYCCFRIDQYDTIDAITYLGKTPLEVSNLQHLIGMPQMYLNRLAPRYDEGLIPDLPQFLRDNWAMGLFHDRFVDFRSALKGELLEEEAFAAIATDLQERLEMDIELPSREELRSAVQLSTRQLVEKRLVEYLQTNQNHLSMYLVPSAPVCRQMEEEI
ncbi:hypothetical protein T492DRAFT_1078537 [Pavlovales sp. CCMP2436]|nr:hypothetical protein T492DRAFT_1078537 [Pavlovales sp. CCMP2436]